MTDTDTRRERSDDERTHDSDREPKNVKPTPKDAPRAQRDTGDLDGLGQQGTAEPQEGVAEHQGGGIEDAIGGGTSGQGGG